MTKITNTGRSWWHLHQLLRIRKWIKVTTNSVVVTSKTTRKPVHFLYKLEFSGVSQFLVSLAQKIKDRIYNVDSI
ncbi:hypothetical protein HORM4_1030048 [Vibrio harveyi]|nr:hypothetical protein VHARVF571_590047 [Vibrio harveyi]CAH1573656.1 hypothetical protein THOD03_50070 [Vibrio harveyi]CAK6711676.1 hypothetical protein HORM4_1030048 [Vibrio harveyi]